MSAAAIRANHYHHVNRGFLPFSVGFEIKMQKGVDLDQRAA